MRELAKLKGGDLRSIGRSEEVVEDILNDPSLFGEVFEGIFDSDPVVRARAADAVEKVARKHPGYLQPYKSRLLEAADIDQQEVRWHVAQMFSYVELSRREQEKAMALLTSWLDADKSRIVRVFSMQALADIAQKNRLVRPHVVAKIKDAAKAGSPAVTARARKLLATLEGR